MSALVDAEIYNYLTRNGVKTIGEEIERLAREDMGTHPDSKTITIGKRSKLGWNWTPWTPEHPEPPSKPDNIGTYNSICEEIGQDRTYQSMLSGGTYLTSCWFARVNGQWRRIVDGDLSMLRYVDTTEVTIE